MRCRNPSEPVTALNLGGHVGERSYHRDGPQDLEHPDHRPFQTVQRCRSIPTLAQVRRTAEVPRS